VVGVSFSAGVSVGEGEEGGAQFGRHLRHGRGEAAGAARSRPRSAAALGRQPESAGARRNDRGDQEMSVSDGRISRLRVTATVVLALILAVLPLPRWMD